VTPITSPMHILVALIPSTSQKGARHTDLECIGTSRLGRSTGRSTWSMSCTGRLSSDQARARIRMGPSLTAQSMGSLCPRRTSTHSWSTGRGSWTSSCARRRCATSKRPARCIQTTSALLPSNSMMTGSSQSTQHPTC
jgi:hypothetical protein